LSSLSADSPPPPRWWHFDDEGFDHVWPIHIQPGAKRSDVAAGHVDSLKIRVAAPGREGNANAALRTFVTDEFAMSARAVTLIRGAKSRRNVVRVA
jgi:uncharacterized protein (TIGR00251 family)